jgi:tRNA pseudouridine55 synthase
VRALARDMGRALGCYGHLVALRRTHVAPFDVTQAIDLAALAAAAAGGEQALARLLLPIER